MLFFTPKKRKYFAACEYWVYVPGDAMPEQDLLMTRMLSENPHGRTVISAREGLLFSDVRLHLSLVLRSKNAQFFRPDLVCENLDVTPELLHVLSESHSLIKVRYISEDALGDDRHLTFIAHMADAVADLACGYAIYDVPGERLVSVEDFKSALAEQPQANSYDFNVKVVWHYGAHSGHGSTKGLIKKGLPELCTDEAHLDQRVLVCEVLDDAARQIWDSGDVPTQVETTAYGGSFRLEIVPTKSGPYRVRVMRVIGE